MDNESNNKGIKQEVLPDQYFLKEKIVSKLHKIECVLILSVTVNNLGAWNKKFGFYQIHWPLTHRLTELLIIFKGLTIERCSFCSTRPQPEKYITILPNIIYKVFVSINTYKWANYVYVLGFEFHCSTPFQIIQITF